MTILILSTGGTIGALPYKDLKNPPRVTTMPPKGQDFLRQALQKIPNIKHRYIAMEARDSNTMDDAYRQSLVDTIKTSPETMALVTHGTDGLVTTAEFLHKKYFTEAALKNKTIVLTGAMVPLSCGAESDGLPNLRFALNRLEQGQIKQGVYIVLSDYQDEDTQTGWAPRLYRFEPGQYKKIYDPEDGRRSRIKRTGS